MLKIKIFKFLAGYAANNKTETLVKVEGIVDGGAALAGGSESASTFDRIAFKTTQDMVRGNTVCTFRNMRSSYFKLLKNKRVTISRSNLCRSKNYQ